MMIPAPKGWILKREFGDGGHYFKKRSHLQAIITSGEHGGQSWLHLSVSLITGKPPSIVWWAAP